MEFLRLRWQVILFLIYCHLFYQCYLNYYLSFYLLIPLNFFRCNFLKHLILTYHFEICYFLNFFLTHYFCYKLHLQEKGYKTYFVTVYLF